MTERHHDASNESIVLVTGAAGAIGRATVEVVAEAGFRVVGLDRAPAEAVGEGYRHVQVDVGDPAALADALEPLRTTGTLSHVVGIAGGALPDEPRTQDDPMALDLDTFRRSLENNLTAQFVVLQAVLPWLRGGRGGDRSVTFTSSFNGLSAQGMPAYSAAKAGLIGMMHGLVRPLGRDGIRVNVLAPGTVRTPRTERLYESDPEHFERLAAGTALGRVATPSDVAEGFLSLIRMRHMTGQTLIVDGGQTVVHR